VNDHHPHQDPDRQDQEFEDFLERRRPMFRRDVDDGLEPPAELDRIVLRRARVAIEDERPLRMFRMSRWAAPLAIAATLVLGLSMVFKAGMETEPKIPQVTVESAAQRYEPPAEALAPPPPPSATALPAADSGAVVVDLAPWRRDAATWQAEIRRLRSSGDVARAEAEQVEFNRQQRAYAASPDR
jgi:hypothetical protein